MHALVCEVRSGYLATVSFPSCWLQTDGGVGKALMPPLCGELSVYVLLATEKPHAYLMTSYFLWEIFHNFCKVSWNINYMVVGIIVRITF